MMRLRLFLSLVTLLSAQVRAAPPTQPVVTVDAEEEVYRYEPADNGSGPFWCYGNTCIVRHGQRVLVSGVQTLPDAKPLNNVRWLLYERRAEGWKLLHQDPSGRTREPSPLGIFSDGTPLLSVNPTLAPPGAYSGPARPEILRFDPRDPAGPVEALTPEWEGQPKFTEHSYRTFCVDRSRDELLLIQNIGYDHAEWTFRNAAGHWPAHGQLVWPVQSGNPAVQSGNPAVPLRLCYPAVQLHQRAVYVAAVSDIDEPNAEFRAFKEQLTGRKGPDWVYRRLYFSWTPDITSQPFRPWIELANCEETAGWMMTCDLYVDAAGVVHLLWFQSPVDLRLRDKFFPEARASETLMYARVKDGKVLLQRPLLSPGPGDRDAASPRRGRFHLLPDGRLFVFMHVRMAKPGGDGVDANQLVEIGPDGTPGPAAIVPLQKPMTVFFTASVRAGCAPSETLDLLGDSGQAVRYARVRVR